MRYFLLVYMAVATLLVFVARVAVVKRRTGVDPVAERWRDDLRGYVARMLVLAEALVVLDVGLVAVGAPARGWRVPIEALEIPAAQVTGAALLVAALAWVVLAQVHMGDAWRIGVDPDARTDLVTHGLFARSRNPVFLGMRISLLGIFLVAPSALALVAWVLGEVLVQVQVRVEEVYLESVHGQAYLQYRACVPRWVPGPK